MIMAETCRQVLKDIGVDPERMSLEWASAAEGPRFVELITSYVNRIKSKGALGQGPDEAKGQLKRRLAAAVKAAEARKVRTSFGTLAKKLHKAGDYSPETITEGVMAKVLPAFRQERLSQEVVLCVSEEGPCTLEQLQELTGGSAEELEKITGTLVKKGTLKEEGAGLVLAK